MARDIPVGNGRLLVCFDYNYQIRDIFYPHVGQENQAGHAPCRVGVKVDGTFSWVGSDWTPQQRYRHGTMVTDVVARNEHLGLEINFSDCVDYLDPILLREIRVKDISGKDRNIQVMFFHDLNMYENPERDTVFYDPSTRAVIHYKDRRYSLSCMSSDRQFGVTHCSMGGKDLWQKAVQNDLPDVRSATGEVASISGLDLHVSANSEQTCYAWLAFGLDYTEVRGYNNYIWERTPEELIRRTHNYWLLWTNKEEHRLDHLPETMRDAFLSSLKIIRSHIDAEGGIVSGADSDSEHYDGDAHSLVRPREGCAVALALDRAGYMEAAANFYTFCAAAHTEGGYLLPKYFPSGSLGSLNQPWVREGREALPIHEEDTAMVIYGLWQHFENYRDIEYIEPLYESFIIPAAEFIAGYLDEGTKLPLNSLDLWGERYGVHTHTTCATIAALWAAAKFAKAFGDDDYARHYNNAADEMKAALVRYFYHNDLKRFARSGYRSGDGYDLDMSLDASLYGLFAFNVFTPDDERLHNTLGQVKEKLWVRSDVGGVARYENDPYMRADHNLAGNPWLRCTLWMAQWDIYKAGNTDDLDTAQFLLEYTCKNMMLSHGMPEQLHPHTCAPMGLSPSVVVHGELLNTIIMLLEKQQQFNPEMTWRRQLPREIQVYSITNIPQEPQREPERAYSEST